MTKESSCSKIRIITRVTAAACLLSMVLCYKLWLNDRNFPLSPLFDFLPILHHPFDLILPVLSGVFLLFIIFLRNPQRFILGFIITVIGLSVFDMNRWQPWFYQYVLMFFLLIFFNYRCDDVKQQNALVTTFKLMIAAVYFWSGLQKLNPHFLSDTFPWLMEPITNHLGKDSINHFRFLGYSFPLIEMATGICLLINSLQRLAVISVVIMHVFILYSLGPLGHNYNPVVWPWNIAMVIFALILFNNEESFTVTDIRNSFHFHSSKIVLVLFLLMPLFNFFNCWDSYLSHNLYSGNTAGGVIYVSDSVKMKLPAYLQQYAIGSNNQNQINIKYWCFKETGVPAYPEKRNFDLVTKKIFDYTNDSANVYFMYTPKLSIKKMGLRSSAPITAPM